MNRLRALLSVAIVPFTLFLSVSSAQAEYALRPGDVVRLTVFGSADLSHSSQVDLDGFVSLPIVGRLPVAGLTLNAVRETISDAATTGALRRTNSLGEEVVVYPELADIVVDIIEYSPIVASGDVVTPGQIPFRPGMTARQLLADAGGLRVPDPRDAEVLNALSSLAGERLLASRELEAVTAQARRVEAQLDAMADESDPTVQPSADAEAQPPADVSAGTDPVAKSSALAPPSRPVDLLAEFGIATPETEPGASLRGAMPVDPDRGAEDLDPVGQRIVAADQGARSADRALTEDLIGDLGDNLDILQARRAEEEELLTLARSQVERLSDLADRGLVPEADRFEALRALQLANAQILDTQTEIAALRTEVARVRADRVRGLAADQVRLLEELEARTMAARSARTQLDALDARLAALEGLIDAARQEPTFVLHRGSGGSALARNVGPDEPLEPGDTVEVVLPPSSLAPSPATDAPAP